MRMEDDPDQIGKERQLSKAANAYCVGGWGQTSRGGRMSWAATCQQVKAEGVTDLLLLRLQLSAVLPGHAGSKGPRR